jgi:hypothetical protein
VEFTKLESAALALLVDEYGWEFPGLAGQLAFAHPVARENTGGGFFTDVAIDKNGILLTNVTSPIDGIGVRPAGMRTKLEIMLFFKDGFASLLEGYSIEGEDTSGVDFEAGNFSDLGLLWPSRKKKTE